LIFHPRLLQEEEFHLQEISIRKFFRGRVSSTRDINQEVLQRKSFICKRCQSGSSSEEEFHLQEISIRKFFGGRDLSARDISQRCSSEEEHCLQEI
jgi:hypothetical protein